MKKSTFWKLMLMILPIAAVGLATTPDSVIVFDPQAGATSQYSYFELMTDAGTLQMATPMAAMLSGLAGILAAVYLGTKKNGCLKAVVWTAFLSSVCAVLPVMAQGGVKVVPNMLLPILMLSEAAIAQIMVKKPADEERKAPRLDRR